MYYNASQPGTEFSVTDDYSVRFPPGSLYLADTVFAYLGHDDNKPLGKTPKTLQVSFDGKGMPFVLKLSDTSYARDLVTLMEDEVIEGCSFGCYPIKTKITREGDRDVRWIERAEVFEVSPTHNPAFTGSSVALLERDEWIKAEIERLEKIVNSFTR